MMDVGLSHEALRVFAGEIMPEFADRKADASAA